MAELVFKFDNFSELDSWLQIFKKYGLDEKINPKPVKKKKAAKEQKPIPSNKERNWNSIGIGNLHGGLDNIPNLRDYAYED